MAIQGHINVDFFYQRQPPLEIFGRYEKHGYPRTTSKKHTIIAWQPSTAVMPFNNNHFAPMQ